MAKHLTGMDRIKRGVIAIGAALILALVTAALLQGRPILDAPDTLTGQPPATRGLIIASGATSVTARVTQAAGYIKAIEVFPTTTVAVSIVAIPSGATRWTSATVAANTTATAIMTEPGIAVTGAYVCEVDLAAQTPGWTTTTLTTVVTSAPVTGAISGWTTTTVDTVISTATLATTATMVTTTTITTTVTGLNPVSATTTWTAVNSDGPAGGTTVTATHVASEAVSAILDTRTVTTATVITTTTLYTATAGMYPLPTTTRVTTAWGAGADGSTALWYSGTTTNTAAGADRTWPRATTDTAIRVWITREMNP